jgi:hypothetical protein
MAEFSMNDEMDLSPRAEVALARHLLTRFDTLSQALSEMGTDIRAQIAKLSVVVERESGKISKVGDQVERWEEDFRDMLQDHDKRLSALEDARTKADAKAGIFGAVAGMFAAIFVGAMVEVIGAIMRVVTGVAK